MIFEHCPDGIMITDARGYFIEANASFTRLAGFGLDELLDKNVFCLWAANHGRTLYKVIRRSIASTGEWHGEVLPRLMHQCARRFPLRINAIRSGRQETVALVWTLTDETWALEKQRELVRLAHHDPLTGLPNRRALMSQLEYMLNRPRKDTPGAVMYIDLDGFKQVNDTFGHRAGDNLLQAVAARLSARLRHADMLARLGGDEFVITLERIAHERDVGVVAEHVIELLQTPFELVDGSVVQIGASVGIAHLPHDRISAELLLDRADRALYVAKRAGKGVYRFFEDSCVTDA
jgi:diguanylate cyclase (GGDEF)-like protein/PAS domain S-box-containing protein